MFAWCTDERRQIADCEASLVTSVLPCERRRLVYGELSDNTLVLANESGLDDEAADCVGVGLVRDAAVLLLRGAAEVRRAATGWVRGAVIATGWTVSLLMDGAIRGGAGTACATGRYRAAGTGAGT